MIKNKCNHEWEMLTSATFISGVGATPAFYKCKQCKIIMTAQETFQLEALENQNETLRHLKGFQKWISVLMGIITILSLLVAILVAIFK